jgi:hypothetical protein
VKHVTDIRPEELEAAAAEAEAADAAERAAEEKK